MLTISLGDQPACCVGGAAGRLTKMRKEMKMATKLDIPETLLREMYVERKMTVREIAKELGYSERTIRACMDEYGIEVRIAGQQRIELPEDELCRLYVEEGLSTVEIGLRLGCNERTVANRLEERGIARRPRSMPREHVPKQLHAQWNGDLAYSIGLIASDGNLERNTVQVCFTSTDMELIELYCGCLQLDPSVKIQVRQSPLWKESYKIAFNDVWFRAFLEDIGLTPAKSKTIGPLLIPDAVFADFVRGCWDGDGTWVITQGQYLRARLASASPRFLEWMQNRILLLSGLSGCKSGDTLMYSGRYAIALGKWLYYAPDVPALSRKRAIWERFASASHLAGETHL
jgi:DNA-binding CsgD family transcriptional regulator